MYFIPLIILFISLAKEFLLLNQELIIYITFLSLTFLAVYSFKFLKDTFNQVREDYIKSLQSGTLSNKYDLTSYLAKSDFYLELTLSSYNQ